MLANVLLNKNTYPIVRHLFDISLVFVTQSYFAIPKNIRLNSMHYFIMKTLNKRKLQQIAVNHLSDIDFKGSLQKMYCTVVFLFS